MFLTILFYIFIAISIIDVMHFGFYLIGANYYDIKQFKNASQPIKRKRGLKPLVSVLIPAHNEETGIIRTLESVRKNSYRKLQIVVIDDCSTDRTRALVRQYIAKYPNRNIHLMYKRKNVGKAMALNHALKNKVKGDLVMTLDADSEVGKKSIANAVKYFEDPLVVGVAANVRVLDSMSILGLLQKFEYMISYRSKKFFSATNCEFIIGGVASTYRTSTLKKVGYYDHDIITEDIALSLKIIAQGNRANRVIYGFDVLAMTEGVQTFKALLRQRYRWKMGVLQSLFKHVHLVGKRDAIYSRSLVWYRLPMSFIGEIIILLEPFAIGYVIYLSTQVMSTALIVGSYLTISVYLLWNILPDEHMNIMKKFKMSGYVPVMYFIMYLMNIVQLVAVIRCLAHPKQVLRKQKTVSTWASPARAVQTQPQIT